MPAPAAITRRVLFAIGYSIFLIAALVGVCYAFFYLPWIRSLRETRRPEEDRPAIRLHVDQEVANLVGWLHTPRQGSFVGASLAPEPGTRRLCAFGDSFTYGGEVAAYHDYPALLETRLLESGVPAEVINFGVSWWGFHQAFILWDRVGRKLGCDVLLLGPRTFYPDRDTSFSHTGTFSPYNLHARYVIDGEDVRLLEVLGDTHEDRFDHYFRYLQYWRYLRYDRRAPVFLRCMIPESRVLPNPFYYLRDSEANEARQTYKILLSRMATAGSDIIISSYTEAVLEIAESLGQDGLSVLRPFRPLVFPNLAPRNHNSSWGNEVLAAQFQSVLTPGSGMIPVAATKPLAGWTIARSDGSPAAVPISDFDRVEVAFGDVVVGVFARPSPLPGNSGPEIFRSRSVQGLVGLAPEGTSPLDGVWVTTDFEASGNLPISVAIAGAEGATPVEVGRLQPLSSGIGIGTLPGMDMLLTGEWQLDLQSAGLDSVADGERVVVKIGQKEVARGRSANGSVSLMPIHGDSLYRVRAPKGAALSLEQIEDGGLLEIVLRQSTISWRVPVALWHLEERPAP